MLILYIDPDILRKGNQNDNRWTVAYVMQVDCLLPLHIISQITC